MRARIKSITSNETTNWNEWRPADPTNVMHWFTLEIGPEGEQGADLFQIAVATRRVIAERHDRPGPFRGLVLDPFGKGEVEPLLRKFVAELKGESWDAIVEQPRKIVLWEYEHYNG